MIAGYIAKMTSDYGICLKIGQNPPTHVNVDMDPDSQPSHFGSPIFSKTHRKVISSTFWTVQALRRHKSVSS